MPTPVSLEEAGPESLERLRVIVRGQDGLSMRASRSSSFTVLK